MDSMDPGGEYVECYTRFIEVVVKMLFEAGRFDAYVQR